jgi:hypothetical protein
MSLLHALLQLQPLPDLRQVHDLQRPSGVARAGLDHPLGHWYWVPLDDMGRGRWLRRWNNNRERIIPDGGKIPQATHR